MPHFPKPFFRSKKKRWYVELDGKHVNLGADEEFARAKYYEIMADRAKSPRTRPSAMGSCPLVVAVLDAYLEWLSKRVQEATKAPRTFAWYKRFLQSFANFAADDWRTSTLTVNQLQPIHVYQWADANPGWKTGRRGAITAIQRAMNWAARAGLLTSLGGRSPLVGLEKPAQGRREQLVSHEEFTEVMSLVRDQEFRDLLTAAWETGARPHELFAIEAAYVDLENARWVFPIRLSKGRKIQRVVYLNDRMLAITRRLIQLWPQGPIFRNTHGRPWHVSSVKCRFQKVRLMIGQQRLHDLDLLPPKMARLNASQKQDSDVRNEHERNLLERRKRVRELALQHGTRYNLYAFRHSMITEALVAGLDAVTVSVLAGHRDTSMISRHYAHLTQQHAHMRDAARKVRGA